jgi:hypothetical protein
MGIQFPFCVPVAAGIVFVYLGNSEIFRPTMPDLRPWQRDVMLKKTPF